LIAALAAGNRVLLLGVGSGRHIPPLLGAGLSVDVVEEDPARAAGAVKRWAATPRVRIARARYAGGPVPFAFGFDGALATHALLHGDAARVAAALAAVGNRLRPGAPFNFTLGSTRDPRFERGKRIDAASWAPEDGDEAGVAHVYFDERGMRALLDSWDVIEVEEREAGATAGAWAHPSGAGGLVHWFVRARRRSQ
jgi:hypothetical protein